MYHTFPRYNHADYIVGKAIHFQTVPVIFPLIQEEESLRMKSSEGVIYFLDNERSI